MSFPLCVRPLNPIAGFPAVDILSLHDQSGRVGGNCHHPFSSFSMEGSRGLHAKRIAVDVSAMSGKRLSNPSSALAPSHSMQVEKKEVFVLYGVQYSTARKGRAIGEAA